MRGEWHMLQIITGKFYRSEDRYHNDCQAKLYSNVKCANIKQIGHIKIEPVEDTGDIAEYNVFYDNQLENTHSGFELVNVGNEEVVRQFKNIMAFVLKGVFDEDKSVIEKICRKKTNRRYPVPAEYLPLLLDVNRNLSEEEVKSCTNFFEHLIGLKRKDYMTILNCIVAYNVSVSLLNEDVSLAYSILIYCLESLAQSYDSYIPVWEDYKEDKKNALEKVFESIASEDVEKIKEILLKDEHLKLSKRFCLFVEKNVSINFFDNQESRRIIGKEEFGNALINAYNSRSQYVHMLKPLMKHLTEASFSKSSDIFEFDHKIYFTYSGLLRVAWDVIYNYTMALPETEQEVLDWKGELPGSLDIEVAPYFWIWKMDHESGINAIKKLEGFIECFVYYKKNIPKMDELVKMYITHLDNMKSSNKMAAFTLACLYVGKIGNIEEETRNEFVKIFDKNKKLFEKCSIYSLLIMIMQVNLDFDMQLEWKMEDCEAIVNAYCKNRFKSKRIKLPKEIETMIFLILADGYRNEKDEEKREVWLQRALDNSNNSLKIQEAINDYKDESIVQLIDHIWSLVYQRFEKESKVE